MIEPQPPEDAFSALVAFVSPVSSKKKFRKPCVQRHLVRAVQRRLAVEGDRLA